MAIDIVLQYILQCLPALVAIAGEIGVVKWAISTLKEVKETKEFKEVVQQNKILINELREERKLNKQLLTKIDRIHRGEE